MTKEEVQTWMAREAAEEVYEEKFRALAVLMASRELFDMGSVLH
jgi:hypothetical protein